MGWGLESEMGFGVDYPKHDATAVYMLAKIARELGIDPGKYAPGSEALAWQTRSTDWDGLMSAMTAEIERLRQRGVDANAALRLEQHKVELLSAQRDEAQAEVRAMLEGRREEEERARMRLLTAAVTNRLDATFMPSYSAVTHAAWQEATAKGPGAKVQLAPDKVRAALLADLDALVALGLRGEVVHD